MTANKILIINQRKNNKCRNVKNVTKNQYLIKKCQRIVINKVFVY